MGTFRGVPKFPNAVEIGGRLVADPEQPRNPYHPQARFEIAHQIRADKAYFIEVNVFDADAELVLHGDEHRHPLRKGDTVIVRGRLNSYDKAVQGVKGRFHVRRVTVIAEQIELLKRAADRLEEEPGFDDET